MVASLEVVLEKKDKDKNGNDAIGKGARALIKAGSPIEGGLTNEVFARMDKQKGFYARFTTNDKGEITEILVVIPNK